MLCHFLTVLSLQKKRDFWRSISLALGFLYVQNRVKRKKIQVISILISNYYEWHFQPYKKWVCDDEPLKTVLMLRFITSGAKICQYVYCCLCCDDFGTGATNHYFGQKDGPTNPLQLFRIPCTKNFLSTYTKSRDEKEKRKEALTAERGQWTYPRSQIGNQKKNSTRRNFCHCCKAAGNWSIQMLCI